MVKALDFGSRDWEFESSLGRSGIFFSPSISFFSPSSFCSPSLWNSIYYVLHKRKIITCAYIRPSGLMVKAPDFGSGDWEFESSLGRPDLLFFCLSIF
jgi:hypothetical protein